ncbi:transposase [Holospora curviuscula]|uniref:Tc1-like transposase DDE domain-containing protein n=1 Tax=Holospora curviuscula TaxID=1082868 RepID=A0A2S5R9P0_9PROT|nr:transposase [Holospora curviuscula]PPE04017.1 hypothetical protein HCUR_00552 [Holospora curviuscula]
MLGRRNVLTTIPENRSILMDNANFHKGKPMKQIIKDVGHTLLYRSSYSHDLNYIKKK